MGGELWIYLQAFLMKLNYGTFLLSSRGANATIFLATVIAVWVAARFSSVMVDKGANTLAKLIGTAFAVSVFLIGLNLAGSY